MKALIVLQNQHHLLGQAITRLLKERHGVSEFCAYVYSPRALEFAKKQNDIKYSSLLADHELHEQHKKEKLDIDFIRGFEREYFPPNLWLYLYPDRKLMMSIGPKEETTAEIDPLYNHEDLMRIFQARARAIEKMLKEEKPDFIFFFAIGALGTLLLYRIAKKLRIRTFNISTPRFGNHMSVSEDYRTLTGAEKIFKGLKIDPGQYADSRKQAQKLIGLFRKTGSLQLQYYELFESDIRKNHQPLHPKNLLRTMKYLWVLTSNYLRYGQYFTYGEVNQNPLRFIAHQIKKRVRKIIGTANLTSPPNYQEDYAYFPLHYEPELSTLTMAPFYADQIALIRQIARSLPLHFKLYIKEHPTMKGRRKRSYYKELLKLPNVKLMSENVKSFDLIKNAKLIVTITGTAGWEGALLGKPVITFGETFFNSLSFVKRVHDIETLPQVISEQLRNFKYNEKEMIDFLTAVIADSFPMNFSSLWYETDIEKIKNDPEVVALAEILFKKASGASELY